MTAYARVGRVSAGLGILLAISVAVGACDTAPTEDHAADGSPRTASAATDGPAGATPSAREVFFPTLKPPYGAPDALGIGTLLVDGRGCLRLRAVGEESATPLWPPGFQLGTEKGGIRVLDTRGRLRAKVGEKLVLGGGYIKRSILEQGGVTLEGKTVRELLERCPGSYFLTQEEGTRMPR